MADGSSKQLFETAMSKSSKLFEHLNFLIVVTRPEQLGSAEGTADLLRAHSCQLCWIVKSYGVEEEQVPTGDVKSWFLDKVTGGNVIHIVIGEDCTFPFYYVAAFDFLIPVVTSDWIHACITARRHVRTSSFSPDSRHIFKDFQIYVSRHSFNSSEYLFYTEVVHALGGTSVDFLSSRTTHLVTKDCQDPGILAVLNFGKVEPIKFVYPTWIIQCFKLLSVAPEGLHQIAPNQTAQSVKDTLDDLWNVVNEINFEASSRILENHSFIIGMDVALSRDLYTTLIDFVQSNGATVNRHLDETDIAKTKADCYIGKSVSSKEYEAAMEVGLHLGNIIWIFYMWSLGDFVPPTAKLIFSPFERKLLERNQLIMAYTNFFGQQRFYIQRLVNSIGGFTTSDLSRRNTHLLCRFPFGKKYETAKKWKDRCIVTNHLWLEGCYKRSARLDPLEPTFQQLPVKGGLRKSLGQMQWQDLPEIKPSEIQAEEISRQMDVHGSELQHAPLESQRQEREMTSPKVDFAKTSTHAEGGRNNHNVSVQHQSEISGENKSKSVIDTESKSPLKLEESQMAKESTRKKVPETNSQLHDNSSQEDKSHPVRQLPLSQENDGEIVQNVLATNTSKEELQSNEKKQDEKRSPNVLQPYANHESEDQEKAKSSERESSHGHIPIGHNEIMDLDKHDTLHALLEENGQKLESSQKANPERLMEEHSEKLKFLKIEAGTPMSSQPKPGLGFESKLKDQRKQNDKEKVVHEIIEEQPELVKTLKKDSNIDEQQSNARDKTKDDIFTPDIFTTLLEGEVKGSNHDYGHSTTPAKQQASQRHQHDEKKSKSQTPTTALTPTSPENVHSSQGTRRAAKAKAARKLHEDIESLNEFQRYSKRKKTENLLPEEIAQLEKRKELEFVAKQILAEVLPEEHEIVQNDTEVDNPGKHTQQSQRKKLLYHINAVHTGSQTEISELDLVILKLIGIAIHNDITDDNFSKMNTIIAPKKLRTAKFLKSFSFHPLKNALTPTFLEDILKIIHKNKRADLQLDLSKYAIPDMDQEKLCKLTSLPTKVFERAGISRINIANDIPGGIEVISSILKTHGVKETKAITTTQMNKLSLQELLVNDGAIIAQNEKPSEYVFLATKTSQVKFLKKLTKENNRSALAVEWDWFVASIFQLQVDFTDSKHVIYKAT